MATELEEAKELLEELADDYGLDYDTDYSGRGMFGAQCLSVTGDRGDMADARDELEQALGAYSEDSMGMGVVLYWRRHQTRKANW